MASGLGCQATALDPWETPFPLALAPPLPWVGYVAPPRPGAYATRSAAPRPSRETDPDHCSPNDVWTADCQGHLKTGDGLSGSPLPGADGSSRFRLGGHAWSSTRVQAATPVFVRLFKDVGLPTRIRTDHGVPIATTTLARRSQLSAWWVRLGILPAFIEPGQPPPNGRHARRPRTLKADTTRPPAHTRMKRSTGNPRPHAMPPRRVSCPINCRPLRTPTVSKAATSVPTGTCGGIARGVTSPSAVPARTSGSKRLTLVCGTSPSGPSHSIDCLNGIGASKMPRVD